MSGAAKAAESPWFESKRPLNQVSRCAHKWEVVDHSDWARWARSTCEFCGAGLYCEFDSGGSIFDGSIKITNPHTIGDEE